MDAPYDRRDPANLTRDDVEEMRRAQFRHTAAVFEGCIDRFSDDDSDYMQAAADAGIFMMRICYEAPDPVRCFREWVTHDGEDMDDWNSATQAGIYIDAPLAVVPWDGVAKEIFEWTKEEEA